MYWLRCIVAASHRGGVASWRRCIVAALHRGGVASWRRCIVAALHRRLITAGVHTGTSTGGGPHRLTSLLNSLASLDVLIFVYSQVRTSAAQRSDALTLAHSFTAADGVRPTAAARMTRSGEAAGSA
jgi:hypothetical protein